MVNEKLEFLLKYINGSLERCSEEELAYLIKNKNIISNIDFYRFRILSSKLENLTFKKSSFRGAFFRR